MLVPLDISAFCFGFWYFSRSPAPTSHGKLLRRWFGPNLPRGVFPMCYSTENEGMSPWKIVLWKMKKFSIWKWPPEIRGHLFIMMFGGIYVILVFLWRVWAGSFFPGCNRWVETPGPIRAPRGLSHGHPGGDHPGWGESPNVCIKIRAQDPMNFRPN